METAASSATPLHFRHTTSCSVSEASNLFTCFYFHIFVLVALKSGYAVATLVEALHCKLGGRGFDCRWGRGAFHWFNPSSRTMALGSSQPVTDRADNLATFTCRLFRNSESLNLLEPSGPVQACTGIVIPLPLPCFYISTQIILPHITNRTNTYSLVPINLYCAVTADFTLLDFWYNLLMFEKFVWLFIDAFTVKILDQYFAVFIVGLISDPDSQ